MQAWKGEKVIHVGAEAEVILGTFLGKPAIIKNRRSRAWRHPELDSRLTRRRMHAEARLLTRLGRRGLPVPLIHDLDIENGEMVLTLLPGQTVIEHLRSKTIGVDINAMLVEIGKLVRRLHREGITHGDLSTNNVLYCQTTGASLIDFGLAKITEEVEDFGIDLHVLHEILGASHPDHPQAIDTVIDGYLSVGSDMGRPSATGGGELPTANQVVERLKDIMTRVRYHG